MAERADVPTLFGGRLPGLALCLALALGAALASPFLKSMTGGFTLPPIVLALLAGMALNALADDPRVRPGVDYAVKKLLRYAIALLGFKIAFSDILALGPGVAWLVIFSMTVTVVAGVRLAQFLDRVPGFGALAGAACAVCGASATLATATVVPEYPQKKADIAFTVVMANGVSTLVMFAYPALAVLFGFSERQTGILLGLTIHDMAQVVGAGYAVSETAGNTAVIVKLFRIMLLLPVVVLIGLWLKRLQPASTEGKAAVPAPLFAIAFIVFAALNSILPSTGLAGAYAPLRALAIEASNAGLLVAMAALGLGTSLRALLSVGFGHVAVFSGATLVILIIGLAGVRLLG